MFMKIINTGSQPGNCYALKSESGEILLMDCGCRYSEILKGISYRISGMQSLVSCRAGRRKALPGTNLCPSISFLVSRSSAHQRLCLHS